MKVALLGHTGFLGRNVAEQFGLAGVECLGASRRSGVNLRDTQQAADFLADTRPDVILHCAANVGSFHYVTENASAVMLDIAQNPDRPGLLEPINVAQNADLSIRELVDIVRTAVGYAGEVHYDTSKPDGALKKVMDDTRFRQVFPDFQFTDFHTGMAETLRYYGAISAVPA